jgi:hypothetical protein
MSDRIELAAQISPLTTLVRGVIEWMFPGSSWDKLHTQTAPHCRTRKLAIASLATLMVQVVAGTRRSLFAAFTADQASPAPIITATYQAVYGRIGRMAPEFSCALVRESARRCSPLWILGDGPSVPGWKGFRVRIIDGTQPDGSEHRLKVLRTIRAAGLPCRLVVQFDLATGLCVDAVAAQDAYASEQKLAQTLYERAEPNDLEICDRHFSTPQAFLQLQKRKAFLLVREYLPQLILQTLGRAKKVGRVETGVVFEQAVALTDGQSGETIQIRRVVIKLDQPTESDDTEIRLLTNLPARVNALKIARLYRQRWSIELHFDLLKNHLQGEIASLGQPCAAIFALCLSMVAANALAVVQRALSLAHGADVTEGLSGYYLADEIAGIYRAVEVLVPPTDWDRLASRSASSFWSWCLRIAQQIRPAAFASHPRGPKHPPPKRTSGKDRHHYSTQRLLEDAKKQC